MSAALERRLRVAAVLVLLGLLVELVSLTWRHPTAFLLFALVGGALLAAGMVWFLYGVVLRGSRVRREREVSGEGG